jgi:hypothetical protein
MLRCVYVPGPGLGKVALAMCRLACWRRVVMPVSYAPSLDLDWGRDLEAVAVSHMAVFVFASALGFAAGICSADFAAVLVDGENKAAVVGSRKGVDIAAAAAAVVAY